MLEVSIDFETRALADLRAVGAWRYARHPRTYVLCLAWSEGRAEPRVWRPLFEPLPARLREIADMAARGEAVFRAWNAAFERNVWNHTLRRGFPDLPELPPEAFVCSMAEALAFGWPGSLEMAAKVSGVAEQKDPRGDYLTRVCGNARYALTRANLDGLADYCKQDVRTEMAVATRSRRLSDRERELYLLDQRINDRGIRVDVPAAKAVLRTITAAMDKLNADLPGLTDGAVEQATQAARIRTWLASRGVHLPDLAAETVERALKRADLPDDARKVLRIRQLAGGSAVAKLTPMILVPDPHDYRARGLLQYHGAAATGRWAGRLIQPQNMPRPALKVDSDDLINSFVNGTALDRFGDDVFIAASDALRPLLTATPGNVLVRADLNAIEARIVLWLAGHSDAMNLFRTGACIYCEMASAVYGRRITKAENPIERQVGKVIVLGCGYQMGAARFQEHAAANGISVTLAEAETFVKAYRSRWHLVPKLWRGLEAACVAAATRGGIHSYRGVDYALHDGAILCRLPSGRRLVWQGASVREGEYGPQVWVKRMRAGQWEDVLLYGGILTERATQALARDVMAEGMLRVERAGVPVVLTVHDEMVTDTGRTDAETILVQSMTEPMPWAPDLPLAAEATSAFRYGK